MGYYDQHLYQEFLYNVDGSKQMGLGGITSQCVAMQYTPPSGGASASIALVNGNCLAAYPFFCEMAQNSSLQMRMLLSYIPLCKTKNLLLVIGCFNQVSPLANYTSPDMTIEFCVEFCRGVSHNRAGLTNDTCYCYDSTSMPTQVNGSFCDGTCSGNPGQPCGHAPTYVSLFRVGKYLLSI